jgi:type IV secretory pathway TraG/TraD family ATPase VirD4
MAAPFAPSPFTFGLYYKETQDDVNQRRELSYAGERHILLFGVNRSGKSTRLLLRALATIKNRSAVVLDIKGELCAQTRRARRKICGADNVKTVNPYNLHGLGSDGFNPLACLDPNDDLFYDKAKRLTLAMIESEGEKDKHWDESAQGLLTAGIMWEVMQAKIEGRAPSLANVRKLICARDEFEEVPPIKQGKTLVPQPPVQVKGLKINCDLMAREGGEQIAGLISRFLRDHGKNELSGIQSTFDTQTQWLLSKPMARDLEKGTWSFAQLRETQTTCYILLPPDEIKDKRRWTRLLFTCALCEHLKPGPLGTLFILDEFRVSVANLEIINTFWSLVAGYGVQFVVVVQSALHLKTLFKDEWEIYAGQAGAVVTIGPPNDRPTAEWMSARAGRASETRTSQNEGQGVNQQGISTSDGTTISQADVAFKTPEELMSIPVGTGRIWVPGRGNTSIPFYAPNYWKIKRLRGLIDDNPYYNGPKSPPASSSWFKYSGLRRHWRIAAIAATVLAGGVYLHNLTGNAQAWPPAPLPPVHKPGPPRIAAPPHVSPSPQRHR